MDTRIVTNALDDVQHQMKLYSQTIELHLRGIVAGLDALDDAQPPEEQTRQLLAISSKIGVARTWMAANATIIKDIARIIREELAKEVMSSVASSSRESAGTPIIITNEHRQPVAIAFPPSMSSFGDDVFSASFANLTSGSHLLTATHLTSEALPDISHSRSSQQPPTATLQPTPRPTPQTRTNPPPPRHRPDQRLHLDEAMLTRVTAILWFLIRFGLILYMFGTRLSHSSMAGLASGAALGLYVLSNRNLLARLLNVQRRVIAYLQPHTEADLAQGVDIAIHAAEVPPSPQQTTVREARERQLVPWTGALRAVNRLIVGFLVTLDPHTTATHATTARRAREAARNRERARRAALEEAKRKEEETANIEAADEAEEGMERGDAQQSGDVGAEDGKSAGNEEEWQDHGPGKEARPLPESADVYVSSSMPGPSVPRRRLRPVRAASDVDAPAEA